MPLSAIILFIRNPELGKVKTRLAKTIGDENALLVYKALLTHTHQITRDLPFDKYVYYADQITADDSWDRAVYQKRLQTGKDLGEKMANACKELFGMGYQTLLIMGSDCYELETGIIQHAMESMEIADVVIGPARDGGYYLIGMQAPFKNIFENISWSTDKVYAQTLAIVEKNKYSIAVLPTLTDVDTEADLTAELKRKSGMISAR